MPILFWRDGEAGVVQRIGGSEKVRRRLEAMGLAVGSVVTVVSRMGENLILSVKDSRIALSHDLAGRIFVQSALASLGSSIPVQDQVHRQEHIHQHDIHHGVSRPGEAALGGLSF